MHTMTLSRLAGALLTAAFAQGAQAALADQVRSADGWIAYQVPMTADAGTPCCYSMNARQAKHVGCDLDGRDWNISTSDDQPHEPATSDMLAVYLHVSKGSVDKVRAYAATCPVRTTSAVLTLDAVGAGESVALLSAMVERQPYAHAEADQVLPALAFHADAGATAALRRLIAPGRAEKLRENALFWLGQARGAEGADIVERVATTDADQDLRAHAVFVLSQAKGPDPYLRIRAISTSDASEHVRSQALFWMAQMHDKRAQADIVAVLRGERSDEVREQAVFALSQLGDDVADHALIEVLRGDFPRQTKERAMFWLGQSGSDAALQYLDRALGAVK